MILGLVESGPFHRDGLGPEVTPTRTRGKMRDQIWVKVWQAWAGVLRVLILAWTAEVFTAETSPSLNQGKTTDSWALFSLQTLSWRDSLYSQLHDLNVDNLQNSIFSLDFSNELQSLCQQFISSPSNPVLAVIISATPPPIFTFVFFHLSNDVSSQKLQLS